MAPLSSGQSVFHVDTPQLLPLNSEVFLTFLFVGARFLTNLAELFSLFLFFCLSSFTLRSLDSSDLISSVINAFTVVPSRSSTQFVQRFRFLATFSDLTFIWGLFFTLAPLVSFCHKSLFPYVVHNVGNF